MSAGFDLLGQAKYFFIPYKETSKAKQNKTNNMYVARLKGVFYWVLPQSIFHSFVCCWIFFFFFFFFGGGGGELAGR